MGARFSQSWGDTLGDGNAAELGRNMSGVIAGVDTTLDDAVTLGIAGGYTHAIMSVDARASRASAGNGHVRGLCGLDRWIARLEGRADYGWGDALVLRNVRFPGFSNSLSNKESEHTTQMFAEAGHAAGSGPVGIEPFVGLAWVGAGTGAFAETGGAAALSGWAKDQTVVFSSLGSPNGY